MEIGNLKIKNSLVLAPMLGVTNLPFRLLCRKFGAGLAFTEMLYVNQILHENEKTKLMMKNCLKDKPLGIQITGSSIDEFKKLLPFLKKSEFDLIDLNCGCPATKIIGTKAGAYLLKKPNKIAEIVKILKKSGKPVSVKIRLGFDKNNVLEIARVIERAGADALSVHARLAKDSYSKPADWGWIKKVKKNAKIPIIGNGDVFSGQDVREMLKICDGVMVGRGAILNPRIFSFGKFGDWKEIFMEYLQLCEKYEQINIQQIKYVGSHYLRGFKEASKMRNEMMKLRTFEEIKKFVEKIKERIDKIQNL